MHKISAILVCTKRSHKITLLDKRKNGLKAHLAMHFNPNKCILPINQVMYSRCIELQVLYYISLKSDKFHTHSKTSSTAKRDILYALKNLFL